MTDIDWNTCAFADEGCTCGRPSLAIVEQTELEKLRATVAELTAERDLSNDLLDGTAKALGLDLDNVHVHHDVPAKVAELTAALAEVREQLTAANRRAQGLEADLRSAQRGLTEYAGQVEQLKRAIREALNGVSHVWDAQRIDWVPVAEYAAKKPAEATR